MTIDAILLNDRHHAVLVVSGRAETGCGETLGNSLRVASRSHTVVDLRQIGGITPEVVKALLCAVGQALDHRRTLRIVVRNEHQSRFLRTLGLGPMVPFHESLGEAVEAAEALGTSHARS